MSDLNPYVRKPRELTATEILGDARDRGIAIDDLVRQPAPFYQRAQEVRSASPSAPATQRERVGIFGLPGVLWQGVEDGVAESKINEYWYRALIGGVTLDDAEAFEAEQRAGMNDPHNEREYGWLMSQIDTTGEIAGQLSQGLKEGGILGLGGAVLGGILGLVGGAAAAPVTGGSSVIAGPVAGAKLGAGVAAGGAILYRTMRESTGSTFRRLYKQPFEVYPDLDRPGEYLSPDDYTARRRREHRYTEGGGYKPEAATMPPGIAKGVSLAVGTVVGGLELAKIRIPARLLKRSGLIEKWGQRAVRDMIESGELFKFIQVRLGRTLVVGAQETSIEVMQEIVSFTGARVAAELNERMNDAGIPPEEQEPFLADLQRQMLATATEVAAPMLLLSMVPGAAGGVYEWTAGRAEAKQEDVRRVRQADGTTSGYFDQDGGEDMSVADINVEEGEFVDRDAVAAKVILEAAGNWGAKLKPLPLVVRPDSSLWAEDPLAAAMVKVARDAGLISLRIARRESGASPADSIPPWELFDGAAVQTQLADGFPNATVSELNAMAMLLRLRAMRDGVSLEQLVDDMFPSGIFHEAPPAPEVEALETTLEPTPPVAPAVLAPDQVEPGVAPRPDGTTEAPGDALEAQAPVAPAVLAPDQVEPGVAPRPDGTTEAPGDALEAQAPVAPAGELLVSELDEIVFGDPRIEPAIEPEPAPAPDVQFAQPEQGALPPPPEGAETALEPSPPPAPEVATPEQVEPGEIAAPEAPEPTPEPTPPAAPQLAPPVPGEPGVPAVPEGGGPAAQLGSLVDTFRSMFAEDWLEEIAVVLETEPSFKGDSVMGYVSVDSGAFTIHVDNEMSETAQRETVIHELGHILQSQEWRRLWKSIDTPDATTPDALREQMKEEGHILWDAWRRTKDATYKGESESYDSLHQGFSEWYSDQLVEYFNDPQSDAAAGAGGHFRRVARRIKRWLQRAYEDVFGREPLAEEFRRYADSIIERVGERPQERSREGDVASGPTPEPAVPAAPGVTAPIAVQPALAPAPVEGTPEPTPEPAPAPAPAVTAPAQPGLREPILPASPDPEGEPGVPTPPELTLERMQTRRSYAIGRVIDEIEMAGWQAGQWRTPAEWVDASGLSDAVTITEVADRLGTDNAVPADAFAAALRTVMEAEARPPAEPAAPEAGEPTPEPTPPTSPAVTAAQVAAPGEPAAPGGPESAVQPAPPAAPGVTAPIAVQPALAPAPGRGHARADTRARASTRPSGHRTGASRAWRGGAAAGTNSAGAGTATSACPRRDRTGSRRARRARDDRAIRGPRIDARARTAPRAHGTRVAAASATGARADSD